MAIGSRLAEDAAVRSTKARRWAYALTACAAFAGVSHLLVGKLDAELDQPRSLASTPYVGSRACAQCHPSHAESFHRTYHRTMTQDATEASVLGAFDGRTLDYLGVRARMQRGAAGEFSIAFGPVEGPAQWSARVERSVGSHRYQQYLARDGDLYFRLPIAWDVRAERFIHMNGAFLTPDPELAANSGRVSHQDYNRHVTRWNDNCVFCHNVHPNPGLNAETGVFATQVAELGVACEACHGPAAEHVAQNKNPLRRYALHTSARADPTIRNPARMAPARSAEVCGRCHGQRITADIAQFHRSGDPFVPGEPLAHYSKPLARDTQQNGESGLFAARFWRDGTARLTAYEFQGYLQSPCAKGGSFSCESCHAMHQGDPAGQLRPEAAGDALCTGCHRAYASPPSAAKHARHPAGAASCVACHMPSIVYGLVSVQLSHRIEVPDPARQARDERPDACTLCHVDRTRSWAAAALAAPLTTPDPAAAVGLSEVAYRLMAGDPIERAVAAHALGDTAARFAPAYAPTLHGLLAETLISDDYPAVRAIAARSLERALLHLQPSAAAKLHSFVATDTRAERRRSLDASGAALVYPPASLVLRLRAQAKDVAIEIGE
jgi:predicted CXXCH cytochrome family protein